MMRLSKKFSLLIFLLAITGANLVPALCRAEHSSPLVLAEDGKTNYQIVIGADAHYGEELAAQELALFLGQITGAQFPISPDSAPAKDLEIVLGETTRTVSYTHLTLPTICSV